MNSGRKDRENKRKYNWNEGGRGGKRFHGTAQKIHREDLQRNGGSRWDRNHQYHSSSNYTWRPHNRNNYNRYLSKHGNYEHQHFDYKHSVSSDPHREQEESASVGPGSETERREKVLATKKRIEEALASKSTDSNNQEINFQDSVKEIKDKNNDKTLLVSNAELRLTNSDFKEIGSVASGAVIEGEIENSDMVLNITPCSSQQRSFDSSCPSTVMSSSTNKSTRVSGWMMSAVNEITTTEPVHGSNVRGVGEKYIQESREQILGNVPNIVNEEHNAQSSVYRPPSTSPKHHTKDDFSRVGRLYQSFLRSRLRGFTLKMKDKAPKPLGPNPLLDKSVLDNQRTENISIQKDKILELEMPRPIPVKMEDVHSIENTQDEIAAEEANEFCKEFSFLLTHPNFLIPPENLEKLGLGHLSEMNELINEKRQSVTETESVFENRDNFLRVRSLNALNTVTENDITFNQQSLNSSLSVPNQSASDSSANMNSLNDGGVDVNDISGRVFHQEISFSTAQENPSLAQVERQLSDPQALNKQTSTSMVPGMSLSAGENTLVESVVEKVVGKLLKTSLNMQALNTNIHSMISSSASQCSSASVQSDASSTPSIPSPQMQAISSKILRLFLIDKQMEELAQEKMKIYLELLSVKEISSTLFNSWAQDQIQQGNVMSVITNTPSSVPELARMLNNEEPNGCTTSLPGLFNKDSLLETITELKKEIVDSKLAMAQKMKVEACIPSNPEPPDPGVSTSNNNTEEINRPKLSVRKDLHDPNASRIFLTCNPIDIPKEEETTVGSTSYNNGEIIINPNNVEVSSNKKKKKSKKKKAILDFVNLIDDTTDEELSSVSTGAGVSGIEESVINESTSKVEVKKTKPGKKKLKNIDFNLHGNTATCMTHLKNALFLGCKEGFLKVFSLMSGEQEFISQIHSDSIVCIKVYTHPSHKFVITGSTDLTLGLFSLQDRAKLETIVVNSPVQCFDFQGTRIYVGTKTGLLVMYRIRVVEEETGEFSHLTVESARDPLQLTSSSILAVKAAKEGSRRVLIVSSRGEQISVWDTASATLLRTFDWCDTVHCLQVYGETPLVFCGTNTQSVKVVNYTTGEYFKDYQLGRVVIQVVFIKTVLFAACNNGKVYVYDVEDDRLLAILPVMSLKQSILCIAVHKQKIIVANNRAEVRAISFPPDLKSHLKKKTATE